MNYAQNALVGYAEKGLMEAAVQRGVQRASGGFIAA